MSTGLAQASGLTSALSSSLGSETAGQVALGGVRSIATQGIGVVIGLQSSFDWKGGRFCYCGRRGHCAGAWAERARDLRQPAASTSLVYGRDFEPFGAGVRLPTQYLNGSVSMASAAGVESDGPVAMAFPVREPVPAQMVELPPRADWQGKSYPKESVAQAVSTEGGRWLVDTLVDQGEVLLDRFAIRGAEQERANRAQDRSAAMVKFAAKIPGLVGDLPESVPRWGADLVSGDLDRVRQAVRTGLDGASVVVGALGLKGRGTEIGRLAGAAETTVGGRIIHDGPIASVRPASEKSFAFNAIENPGPLAHLQGNPAANFINGKYNTSILSEDLISYRAGEAGKPLGQWFTREAPQSVAQVRIDSAVKPQWIDGRTGVLTGSSPIDTVYQIKIPKGTTIYEGPVGYQDGVYLGGPNTNQVFVQTPWSIPGVLMSCLLVR